MDKQPTEARQDELAGIREKMAELVKRACVKYDGASHRDLLIKVHTEEILSQTVSSGKTIAQCIEEATKDGHRK